MYICWNQFQVFIYKIYILKNSTKKKDIEKCYYEIKITSKLYLRQLTIVNILKFKYLIIFLIKFELKFYKLIQTI